MDIGQTSFDTVYQQMSDADFGRHVDVLVQTIIPWVGATEYIHKQLDDITGRGGEGVVLRRPMSFWVPKRTTTLLKVKPHHDAEAIVVGYTGGLGKYSGLLGALIVRMVGDPALKLQSGIVFELSGFTDLERRMNDERAVRQYGGRVLPDDIESPVFKRGSTITFRFNGLTNDGIPSEARYIRS